MPQDPSKLAKEYIDAALESQARLGRPAKLNKATYERALKRATLAMEELTSIAEPSDRRLASGGQKTRT
jgi:hypothetical protein